MTIIVGEQKTRTCDHLKVVPKFDLQASRQLHSYDIRKRWPRFDGHCPDCGQHVIVYASFEHYIAGDW